MKLVILDRDGVINEDSDAYIKSPEEWLPIDGSIDAIARLSKAGFSVAIATNQSGLGRKLFSLQQLEAMHKKMQQLVASAGGEIAGVFYCPHLPGAGCPCRKPKPGLIDAIENDLGISASKAFFVGDSLKDLQAGLAKQCIPILVKTGKGEKTLSKIIQERDVSFNNLAVFKNLAAAATYIIDQH